MSKWIERALLDPRPISITDGPRCTRAVIRRRYPIGPFCRDTARARLPDQQLIGAVCLLERQQLVPFASVNVAMRIERAMSCDQGSC